MLNTKQFQAWKIVVWKCGIQMSNESVCGLIPILGEKNGWLLDRVLTIFEWLESGLV